MDSTIMSENNNGDSVPIVTTTTSATINQSNNIQVITTNAVEETTTTINNNNNNQDVTTVESNIITTNMIPPIENIQSNDKNDDDDNSDVEEVDPFQFSNTINSDCNNKECRSTNDNNNTINYTQRLEESFQNMQQQNPLPLTKTLPSTTVPSLAAAAATVPATSANVIRQSTTTVPATNSIQEQLRNSNNGFIRWWKQLMKCVYCYCCQCCYNNNSNNNKNHRKKTILQNDIQPLRCISPPTAASIRYFVETNIIWKYCLIINVIILLFGGSVRDLYIPASGDIIFNILFIIALIQFTIEIILRILSESYYFNIVICSHRLYQPPTDQEIQHHVQCYALSSSTSLFDNTNKNNNNNNNNIRRNVKKEYTNNQNNNYNHNNNRSSNNSNQMYSSATTRDVVGQRSPQRSMVRTSFAIAPTTDLPTRRNSSTNSRWKYLHNSIGSFLFWCDLVSTLTLLHEISWINSNEFQEIYVSLFVDSDGIPLASNTHNLKFKQTIEVDSIELFVAIGKTARMARFIGSSFVIVNSKKVNWYCFVNVFNLFWWLDVLRRMFDCFCAYCCCCYYHGTYYDYYNDDDDNKPIQNNDVDYSKLRMSNATLAASMYNSARQIQEQGQSSRRGFGNTRRPSTGLNLTGSSAKSISTLGASIQTSYMGSINRGVRGQRSIKRIQQQQQKPISFSTVVGMAMTVFGNTDKELIVRQQNAAFIIQRAWRRNRGLVFNADDDRQYEKSAFFEANSSNHQKYKDTGYRKSMRASLGMNNNSTYFYTTNSGSGNIGRKMMQQMRQSFAPGTTSTTRQQQQQQQQHSHNNSSLRRSGLSTRSAEYLSVMKGANKESQVGAAMRDLTGQRVAIGIIISLIVTVMFTHTLVNTTRQAGMILLHTQTKYDSFAMKAIDSARRTTLRDLFNYTMANGKVISFADVEEYGKTPEQLRPRERFTIEIMEIANISSSNDILQTTVGVFSLRAERRQQAVVGLLSTLFILFIWLFGVTAFTGPVMILIVIPMERMVRLLAMLMVDPLGYQSSSRYRKFVDEEDRLTKNTRWTKEVLKGMETSFLMSTIMRIGSLMKVGFGGAGVEIIRKNLGRDQQHNMLTLTSQGSKVSCIFLFCDIRSFTDATECLQEEVFVFTNQIAAVVHSYCAAYGGSANKNVGDAFLMSWKLDDLPDGRNFTAKFNQADKALLSVVRMCIALRYDDFYLKGMSEFARDALITKFSARGGPIVQMGFGLHAGTAVQGAIGTQRKIDATYVGEAVEHSEFLESSTKKYGLPMLMSESFHGLLDQRNKRRCRKIDQVALVDVDDDDDYDDDYQPEVKDLLTFDVDIDSWWDTGNVDIHVGPDPDSGEFIDGKRKKKGRKPSLFHGSNDEREDEGAANVCTSSVSEPFFTITNPPVVKRGRTKQKKVLSSSGSIDDSEDEDIRKSVDELNQGKKPAQFTIKKGNSARILKEGLNAGNNEKETTGVDIMPKFGFGIAKRRLNNILLGGNDEVDGSGMFGGVKGVADVIANNKDGFRRPDCLVPPKGPVLYNPNVWFSDDMRKIRERYSDGLFFQKFNSGLQAFYSKDWKYAKESFSTILARFEDGPSRYFLTQIENNNDKPPPGFKPYG